MLCVEELLQQELFQSLPPERLDWICDRATEMELPEGAVLVREGESARGFFILVTGRISITRKSSGIEMPIGQHEAPGFFGEVPVLTDAPTLVTLRTLTDCRLYELTGADFLELLHECRDFERIVFRAVQKRLRGLESFIQGREKMAALGTLAAGLAHELNNPAAALVRALQNVIPSLIELERMSLVYGQQIVTLQVDEDHTLQWHQVREAGFAALVNPPPDGATLSLREDRLLEWLEEYGVKDAWKLAGPLASAGIEPATLAMLTDRWRTNPTELREMGLHWLALSFDVVALITGGLRGAERIEKLVQSMKSYSFMDQGAQQMVDVHQGLEDTLLLFSHRLKQNIEVRRRYDRSLPPVLAYGSELNQVWTNLIDNAIDALDAVPEAGVLEIITQRSGEYVQVQIIDSGTGIPLDYQSRIYEPFFTTKPVGQGSGLGLDVARRIVENRHRGVLSFESRPGRTSFIICLPPGVAEDAGSE